MIWCQFSTGVKLIVSLQEMKNYVMPINRHYLLQADEVKLTF